MTHFRDDASISRRSALVRLGRMSALGGLAAAGWAESLTGQGRAGTAFALIGDRYHNSDHYRTAMGKTIVRDLGVSVDFSDEVTLLNPEHLANYRLLIILRDGISGRTGTGTPRATRVGGARASTRSSATRPCRRWR